MKSEQLLMFGGAGLLVFYALQQRQQAASTAAIPRYVAPAQPQIIYQQVPAQQASSSGSWLDKLVTAGTVATSLFNSGSTLVNTIKNGQKTPTTPPSYPPTHPSMYA